MSLYADIRFETGQTSHNPDQSQVVDGDMDSHIWNGAVGDRLSSYRPEALALDGVEPFVLGPHGNIGFSNKAWLWYSLPGSPRDITGSGELTVLAADNIYNMPDIDSRVYYELALRFVDKIPLGVAAGMLIDDLLNTPSHVKAKVEDVVEPEGAPHKAKQPKYNRRGFLAYTGGLLGLAGGLAYLNGAALSPFEATESVSTAIDDFYNDGYVEDIGGTLPADRFYTYAAGRVALMVTKLNDAYAAGLIAKNAAAVMDNANYIKTDDIVSDSDLRVKCIRNHTELMLQAASTDTHSFTGPGWTPALRRQWVKHHETSLQVFSVIQPDPERFSRDPDAELSRIIQFEGRMTSPTVHAAIEDLPLI